eukprot:1132252-Rhodomonas_salina.1
MLGQFQKPHSAIRYVSTGHRVARAWVDRDLPVGASASIRGALTLAYGRAIRTISTGLGLGSYRQFVL